MKKLSLLLVLGLFLQVAGVQAQNYPVRPVRILIPFGAGGNTDQFARNLAAKLQKHMPGAKLLPENRVGASGTLAAGEVARALPDGYTMLIGRVTPVLIQPSIDSRLSYRFSDFTVLGILEIDPLICVVNSDSAYQTARELILAIRKQPGHLKYATVGGGSVNDLATLYWLNLSGLKPGAAVAQHFEGNVEIDAALMSGKVQFFCGVAAGLLPKIHAGTYRALFTTAPGRLPELPELRNASEVGLRDMGKVTAWTAILAPRGMPPRLVKYWKDALAEVGKDPDWISETTRHGGQPALNAIRDPEKFMQDQYNLYEQLIATLELKK